MTWLCVIPLEVDNCLHIAVIFFVYKQSMVQIIKQLRKF